MKKSQSSIIFIFIFAFLFTEATCLKNQEEDNKDYYNNLTFIIIYSVCWLFLIEISLIIIFHFKHNGSHIANHSFINMVVVLTQAINFFIFWKNQKFTFNQIFGILEIVAFIFELIQILLGNLLNSKLMKTKFSKGIFVNHIMHSNFGKIIYILRKYQVGYYLYFLIKNRFTINPIIVLVIIYLTIVMIHLLVFIFVRGKPFKIDKYPIKYLTEDSKDSTMYQQLLQQIQNNEVQESMSEEELSLQMLQTDNQPLNTSLLDGNPNNSIRWVLIEDHLFDISSLRHPRGQYIMKSINGKDITREIYGLKEMRFENEENKNSKSLKHAHSWKTLRHITNYCIGPIDLPKLIVQDEGISREVSSMSMDLQILNNQLSIFQKDNLIKFENYSYVEDINLGQKNQILFIEKNQKSMFFVLNSYWIDLLGKYFIVQQNNDTQYFYFALCLSPVYLKAKNEWMKTIDNEVTNSLLNNVEKIEKELLELYDQFKKTESDKQQNILKLNPDNLSSYQLPVIKSFKQKNLIQNENLYFKGPLGTGLGFDDQTTHKYLILVEDDGILPLLDFLEFLGQRALIEFSDKNDNTHPIFQRDWFYSYCNDVEFYIYWEINEKFLNASQILGVKQLQTIYLTYEKQTENSPKKIMQNALLSCQMEFEHVPSIKAQLNNLEEIMNNVLPESEPNRANRYILSGSDKFIDRMMKGSNEKRSRFKIL